MLEPLCANFRVITAMFSGVRIFRKFTVYLQLKSHKLEMTVTRRDEGPAPEASSELAPAPVPNDVKPFCKFVNVKLCGLSPHEGVSGTQATVLLESPQGKNMLDADGLLQQVNIGLI